MGSYFTMMLMLMFNHYCHIAIVNDYVETGAYEKFCNSGSNDKT